MPPVAFLSPSQEERLSPLINAHPHQRRLAPISVLTSCHRAVVVNPPSLNPDPEKWPSSSKASRDTFQTLRTYDE
jgi:hypothetical protein